MRTWTRIAASLVLLASLLAADAANAGIPVIDSANLVQSIQQVLAWAQQKIQMASQIANQATQIERITGSRNLGQVFNNLALQASVPGNLNTVLGNINVQGFGGMTTAAQALRTATSVYNCVDRVGSALTSCQAVLNGNAQARSYQQSALALQQQRVTEIQNMQQQINGTTDPMAIGQVHAALQAESAQVANDANRIALMNQSVLAQQQAAEQALLEKQLVQVSPSTRPTVTNFQWQLP